LDKKEITINPMQINRKNFVTKLVQAGLLGLLGLVAYFLGSRVVTGKNCSSCPGNGICKGETDCSRYLDSGKHEGR